MNAEKLKDIVQRLIEDEGTTRIQKRLSGLNNSLTNFMNQPSDPNMQIQVASSLEELRTAISGLTSKYDPAFVKRIEEIGAGRHFGYELVQIIEQAMADNQMMPAVVKSRVEVLSRERAGYIEQLTKISGGLSALGIEADSLIEGEAEIGFQIPRDLFHNELHGLICELYAIRRIIRAFSELATGSAEPIEVRQISTSDPNFYFGLSITTIAFLGGAITWALNSWKQVEDIRNVRAQTAKLSSFTPEEAAAIFDKKIKETIDKAVEQKVNELLPLDSNPIGRINEQRTDMDWALKAILARVERGMTVEIKFLPSAPIEGEEEDKAVEKIKEVIPQLKFPMAQPNPILALPKMGGEEKTDNLLESQ